MMITSIVLAVLAQAAPVPAQLPPAPDPKPVPITGVVVDGSGAPVLGADVWLAEAVAPGEGRRVGLELWWSSDSDPAEGTAPILVHARTDTAGRFALDLPAEAVARRSPPPLAVWAATTGKGARVALRRLPRIVLAADPPVRIELGPSARAAITVRGPDGKPIAGARAIPVRAGQTPIPEPMGRALAATTDANGRVAISGLAPEALDAVRVEAAGFGAQTIAIPDSRFKIPDIEIQLYYDVSVAVALAPVGRISGRLVAPDGEPIRGVTIRATTQAGGYQGSGISGTGEATCDPRGRFEIPTIAAGMLTLELEFDREQGTPLRGEPPKRRPVQAGRTTEVTIPMRETLRVHGLVREEGPNRPIQGVKIALNGQLGGDRFAVTGAEGKFAGRIVRDVGQPYGWAVRIPAPFFEPADRAETSQNMPPRGVGELELRPIELPRGVDVRGIVTGEDGKPVAGAEVEALWTLAYGVAQAALTRTDRAGGFTLRGVDPLAELSLTAWDGFASTPAITVRAEAARTRPIAVTISPKNAAPIAGRVLDSDGKPIAGASVRIRRQARAQNGRAIIADPVADADYSVWLRTDAEGRYRTLRRFPAHGEYYAEASAPGRLTARSPAIRLDDPAHEPPALVLLRVRTIEGRVVDRQGKPVAGAVVRQSGDGPMPTEALTAPDGRFRLPGVLDGPALVFAEKAGFRFQFQPIDDESKPIEIVLARADEPPAVSYRTLPPALPVEEEKALARRLIRPYAERVLQSGTERDKYRFLVELSTIDPFDAAERLETVTSADPDLARSARISLVEGWARESLGEATALIEASPDADTRAWSYVGICDARRDRDPNQLRELLIQAALNARSMRSLSDRLLMNARIADHWLDLGETGRARTLLDEALEISKPMAKDINSGRYQLGEVAQVLARVDLPAALKTIDELARDLRQNDASDRRYFIDGRHGHIAYARAAQSPADAERVLQRMPIKPENDRYIAAVCSKMAPKDPARARRIAETRTSDASAYRPYALGLMARALASSDKSAARRLIEDAYALLERLAASGRQPSYPGFVEVAAGLLPIAEQIEPDRLDEAMGRTLAQRPARGDWTDRGEAEGAQTAATLAMAMMIARYDRRLAARLLEPELQAIGTHQTTFGTDYATSSILAALALIDPRRAVERIEALPDDPAPGTDAFATKNWARLQAAKLLASHDADLWQYVYEYYLYLWTPDQRYW